MTRPCHCDSWIAYESIRNKNLWVSKTISIMYEANLWCHKENNWILHDLNQNHLWTRAQILKSSVFFLKLFLFFSLYAFFINRIRPPCLGCFATRQNIQGHFYFWKLEKSSTIRNFSLLYRLWAGHRVRYVSVSVGRFYKL